MFFALQPTRVQSATLVESIAPVVKELEGQPVPAANLHATLCFIGAVAHEQLPELRAAASSVRGRAFALDFDALDFWEKPEILCATATENNFARDLSGAISAAAMAAGFAPDLKPLRAHLTLARKVRRRIAEKLEWPRAMAPVHMHCEQFVLMQSRRDDTGSTYSVVDSWPLYEK